ncbi:hypothetical protein Paz_23 [Xylella phage Paz]|uniref:Uncharacterized protein n=1 Tax=Xylella phage Paz TaxID=1415145 RepID=V5Q9L0_9CAUD|nr:hypothetical protein Paz_23 [Xylella phage Paz]AHB12120.1 hypothetical protein Paz_23 [Xylella phage Paz]
MSTASKNAARILKYTDTRVRLGDDMDDAVTYAIAQVYPRQSEDSQADIFAAIRSAFDEYPNGTSRKIAVIGHLRRWQIGRIYG